MSTAPATRLRVVVLGASGATGRHLVDQALTRGHDVHAVVRDPATYDPDGALAARGLVVHRGDVREPASVGAAITADSVVVSGLGVSTKQEAGVLTAGAHATVAAGPRRIVWLGAIGTGPSAGAVGWVTHRMLRLGFGAEYGDKVTADGSVLAAGGTVVHSGPLKDGAAGNHVPVALASAGRRFFPHFVPRAAVAQVMLDVVEAPDQPGGIVVPVAASAAG